MSDYNRLAPYYDFLSLLSGGYLQRSQSVLLDKIPRGKRALLIGEGSGNFLKRLQKEQKAERAVYLDTSLAMAKKAQKKCKNPQNRTTFVCGSMEAISPRHKFSLISTHYFLDQFPQKELVLLAGRISNQLEDGGLWLFTDFMLPSTMFQRVLQKALYGFFRRVTGISAKKVPDYEEAFRMAGLNLLQRKKLLFGIEAQLWQKKSLAKN